MLSIFGGKITTYRKLAEHALAELAPYFPAMKAGLDRRARRCPAAIFRRGGIAAWVAELQRRYPELPAELVARRRAPARLAARRRSWATRKRAADLGEDFGDGLTAPRSTTWCAKNGRALPTTCCGGAPSAAWG